VNEKEIRAGVLTLARIFQALNSKSTKNGGDVNGVKLDFF
jgi:hypothetical protein